MSVLNVFATQIALNCSSILAGHRQFMAASLTKCMRGHIQGNTGDDSGVLDHFVETRYFLGVFALSSEDKSCVALVAFEGAQFFARKSALRFVAVFPSFNVQQGLVQHQLIPSKRD